MADSKSTLEKMRQDAEFQKFITHVTPQGRVQQVWLGEAIMLLWEIFKLLKDAGCFTKTVNAARTKRAMALATEAERCVALNDILKRLG